MNQSNTTGNTSGKRPTTKLRLLAAAVAVLLALASGEVILRLMDYPAEMKPGAEALGAEWDRLIHRPSAIPGLAYELAPGLDREVFGFRLRTNRLGMRGPEVGAKPAGVRRILALGDSITFGWMVDENQAWPARLAQMLDAGPGRFEVLNLAVSGYSSRDETNLLLQRAPGLSPDLVIVGYCLNDPENEPVQPLSAFYARPAWWQHSNLLRLLWKGIWLLRIERYGGGDYFLYLHRYPPAWQTVTNSFARLGQWSRELHVPVMVAIFPDLSRPAAGYPYAVVHDQVAAAARAAGLDVLDLRPAYDAEPRELTRISAADAHPSPLGHQLAARAILEAVEQLEPGWFQ